MTTDPFRADPHLASVLERVIAEPEFDSGARDPARVLRGLRDGSLFEPLKESALDGAQRELLQFDRVETARLLRAYHRHAVSTLGYTAELNFIGRKEQIIDAPAHLDRFLRRRVDLTGGALKSIRPGSDSGSHAARMRVLSISFGLDPHPSGVAYLIDEYFAVRERERAEQIAVRAIERGLPHLHEACAWQRVGCARSEFNDSCRALEAYEQAVSNMRAAGQSASVVARSVLNSMLLAIEADDRIAANRHASHLPDLVSLHDGVLASEARRLRRLNSERGHLLFARRDLARDVARACPQAEEFLNALD